MRWAHLPVKQTLRPWGFDSLSWYLRAGSGHCCGASEASLPGSTPSSTTTAHVSLVRGAVRKTASPGSTPGCVSGAVAKRTRHLPPKVGSRVRFPSALLVLTLLRLRRTGLSG